MKPRQFFRIPLRGSPESVQDMEPLFRRNLEADIAHWRYAEVKRGRKLNASDVWALFDHMETKYGWHANTKMVMVWNNTWFHLCMSNKELKPVNVLCPHNMDGSPDVCDHHMAQVARALQHAQRYKGIKLPNALFVLNVDDNGWRLCRPSENCTAPMFVLQKWWNQNDPADRDTDIVVPQMAWTPHYLFVYPWQHKLNRAFFRGYPFCGGYPTRYPYLCQRAYFAMLTQKNKTAAQRIDIGITHEFKPSIDLKTGEVWDPHIKVNVNAVSYEPLPELYRHKYLVHLEGITASSRLGQLMHHNAVILRPNDSSYVEYFYRSLTPWKHYVPFYDKHKDDIVEVVDKLWEMDAKEPHKLQTIVTETQHFATHYLSHRAKLMYWKRAIERYTTLFHNMSAEVESLAARLKANGWTMWPEDMTDNIWMPRFRDGHEGLQW